MKTIKNTGVENFTFTYGDIDYFVQADDYLDMPDDAAVAFAEKFEAIKVVGEKEVVEEPKVEVKESPKKKGAK